MNSIGLIAGQGRLPILVARGMRAQGHRVCCVAFRGHFDPELPTHCDEFRQVGVYRIGSWIRRLRGWNAEEAVMVEFTQDTTYTNAEVQAKMKD